ncbi:NAD-dependent epimerase/dehydratase family protein [Cyanobium sp. HWJ4-Hawea]|uniref:NAD-dependent epimerase/dehydratase family protein n=1 Tax=Cyanobium sp. HWJ4-Hawea TaxID=2823713 RepID=UPI0020CEE777|nr:NAD-dependent epimerase/dehydratase family protein [Cyanobium sp. HWJ4-Hawea]MCP9808677.1 NAD-dependent epimerase/dehydratase family protein [Cyanobium sp. HWJ4-Hawea]
MHNVTITGTRGFLGKYVCDVISRYHENIIPIPLFSGNNTFMTTEANDSEPISLLEDALRSSSALLLLGTYSSCQPYDTHSQCTMQNVMLNMRLLQLAYTCGVRNILAIGTCFEFGLTAKNETPLHPLSRLAPVGSYPSSKAAFCILSLDWAREYSVNLIYSRLFQVYGRGEHPSRLFPLLLQKARTGENFEINQPNLIRDFMHASQAAHHIVESLISILDDKHTRYPRVENICSGVGTTLINFASQIWRQENARGQIIVTPPIHTRAVDIPEIVGLPLNVFYE